MLTIFGFLLATITTVISVPQLVKTWRTHDVAGLAIPTLVAWLASHVAWLTYEAHLGDLPTIACTTAAMVIDTITAIIVFRFSKTASWRSLLDYRQSWGLLTLPVFLAAWWLSGPTPAVIILTVLEAVIMIPQVREVFQPTPPTGVSRMAWGLRVATYAGWIAYGLLAGTPLLTAWAWLLFPLATIVLVKTIKSKRYWGQRAVSQALHPSMLDAHIVG